MEVALSDKVGWEALSQCLTSMHERDMFLGPYKHVMHILMITKEKSAADRRAAYIWLVGYQ